MIDGLTLMNYFLRDLLKYRNALIAYITLWVDCPNPEAKSPV